MNCKSFVAFFIFLFSTLFTQAQENTSALLPMPNKIAHFDNAKPFSFTEKTTLFSDKNVSENNISTAKKIINKRLNIALPSTQKIVGENSLVKLIIDNSIKEKEAYSLKISEKEMLISAGNNAGLFYGLMTFDQLLFGDVPNTAQKKVQSIFIEDKPALGFRALMLDPARHFLPVEDVKFYIEQMAKYKFNTLQLHLSDDQGWRMEIKTHPKLTETTALRNTNNQKSIADNGFYTQKDLKEIVEFASNHHIEIIPEFDVPGHTVALLKAYPELRCDFMKDEIFDLNKTTDKMLSAANPQVYKVLDDIIKEVAEVFPSKKIHLGGDESAIEKNWSKSPENLELMKKLGYTKPEQLMNYFFGNVLQSVRKYKMKAILWCELDNIRMPANEYLFDYPQDVTLVSWRMGLTPKCIELTAKSNHALILAPGEYCYLDYPQYKNDLPEYNNWGMPITTLAQSYEFDPTYQLSEKETQHIVGVMGTLWGEAIKDINRANYMTWPRGFALAEAGWTNSQNRDWHSFVKRLYPNIDQLIKQGVSVRAPFEISKNK